MKVPKGYVRHARPLARVAVRSAPLCLMCEPEPVGARAGRA